MSDFLSQNDGRGLDPRWTLTPVGGIDKLPTFIALLGGSDLNITVLMDGAAGGNQKLTSLIERGLLDKRKLIPITDITRTPEADIEDLFDRAWYTSLLGKSGIGAIDETNMNGGRVVKQIEKQLGHRFDHYRPASFLLRDRENHIGTVDEGSQLRFQELIDRINEAL